MIEVTEKDGESDKDIRLSVFCVIKDAVLVTSMTTFSFNSAML